MRTLVLALALFLAQAAPAQQGLSFNGGSLHAQFILPMDWQGRPAFLLVGPANGHVFARVAPPHWGGRKPMVGRLSARVLAAHFQDLRPCAPGSSAYLAFEDFWGFKLGTISTAGTMTWMAPTVAEGLRIAPRSSAIVSETWFAYYCGDWCHGACRPNQIDGPQLSALVVVLE